MSASRVPEFQKFRVSRLESKELGSVSQGARVLGTRFSRSRVLGPDFRLYHKISMEELMEDIEIYGRY